MRNNSNTSSVKNCLFTNTTALYVNQSTSTTPAFSNNNYFNAPAFTDATIKSNVPDLSGSSFDPEFKNAASGDFTVGNGAIIDNLIGDPRWRK